MEKLDLKTFAIKRLLEKIKEQNKLIYDITKENDRLTMENVELKENSKALLSNQESMYETNKVLLERINKTIKYINDCSYNEWCYGESIKQLLAIIENNQ